MKGEKRPTPVMVRPQEARFLARQALTGTDNFPHTLRQLPRTRQQIPRAATAPRQHFATRDHNLLAATRIIWQ